MYCSYPFMLVLNLFNCVTLWGGWGGGGGGGGGGTVLNVTVTLSAPKMVWRRP